MRHSVTTPFYRLRKYVDGLISMWTPFVPFQHLAPQLSRMTFADPPRGWLALYTMVTFRPDISYAAVRRKAEQQNRIFNWFIWGALFASSTGSFVVGTWLWRRRR